MDSLDQVIYFLEQRQQTEDWNIRDAAIAYLKGYQEVLPDYVALKQYWAEQQANTPLTWNELKQMEGEPVWVEGEHGFIWNHRSWVLIDPYDENDDLIICHGTDTGHYEFAIGKEDYGTDWQAYRKERK